MLRQQKGRRGRWGRAMVAWTGIIILPVTAILWVLSYLLIVNKLGELIAGFDRARTRGADKYALWVGVSTFLCGAGLLATWVLIATDILAPKYLLAGVLASAALGIVLAFVGSWKYARR